MQAPAVSMDLDAAALAERRVQQLQQQHAYEARKPGVAALIKAEEGFAMRQAFRDEVSHH